MAGESDMQSGMCLRVEADPETFGDSRTCSWLRNNMGKYGFVFRYPADKEDYTGCTEDLTVIRYVGSGHATSMQQLSMCLEAISASIKSISPGWMWNISRTSFGTMIWPFGPTLTEATNFPSAGFSFPMVTLPFLGSIVLLVTKSLP